MFKFEVNGKKYWISKSIDGFRWMSGVSFGSLVPTIFDAQKQVIDTVQKDIDLSESVYDIGMYWDERRNDD